MENAILSFCSTRFTQLDSCCSFLILPSQDLILLHEFFLSTLNAMSSKRRFIVSLFIYMSSVHVNCLAPLAYPWTTCMALNYNRSLSSNLIFFPLCCCIHIIKWLSMLLILNITLMWYHFQDTKLFLVSDCYLGFEQEYSIS